jgi:hypothetical protein
MIGVDFPREVDCMRCGALTSGRATCELCFEAITELRALALDHDASDTAPFEPAWQTRRDAGRIAWVEAGE